MWNHSLANPRERLDEAITGWHGSGACGPVEVAQHSAGFRGHTVTLGWEEKFYAINPFSSCGHWIPGAGLGVW
jgi:hypothetical protein